MILKASTGIPNSANTTPRQIKPAPGTPGALSDKRIIVIIRDRYPEPGMVIP